MTLCPLQAPLLVPVIHLPSSSCCFSSIPALSSDTHLVELSILDSSPSPPFVISKAHPPREDSAIP